MLTAIDWIVITVYLVCMVAVGIGCKGKQKDVNDYFTAKGTLPGWLGTLMVGLSIAATYFSGVSFLAYPSIIYSTGLVVLAGSFGFIICWALLKYMFLPRFVSRQNQEPYGIIEQKFGLGVRRLAAVLYMGVRIGWMAMLIYAPTLAIMTAMRLGSEWFWPVVLVIGLTSTIFTVFGGIRGVIVTDAIQMVIIIGGVAAMLIYALVKIPTPLADLTAMLSDTGRLHFWEPTWSLTLPMTTWAVFFGMTLSSVGSYVGDQMSLQRYSTSASVSAASRSFGVNVLGAIITILLLAAVGLALSGWYEVFPSQELAGNSDRILPLFIANELPTGIAGLLLAAILAATVSSMTSGINALSACMSMDFGFGKNVHDSQRRRLWKARLISLVFGLLATGSAGLVARLGGLFDIAQKLLGLFLAPLAVCVLLAVTNLLIRPRVMAAALCAGCVVGGLAATAGNLNALIPGLPVPSSLWVSPIAAAVTLLVALTGVRGTAKPSSIDGTAQNLSQRASVADE